MSAPVPQYSCQFRFFLNFVSTLSDWRKAVCETRTSQMEKTKMVFPDLSVCSPRVYSFFLQWNYKNVTPCCSVCFSLITSAWLVSSSSDFLYRGRSQRTWEPYQHPAVINKSRLICSNRLGFFFIHWLTFNMYANKIFCQTNLKLKSAQEFAVNVDILIDGSWRTNLSLCERLCRATTDKEFAVLSVAEGQG